MALTGPKASQINFDVTNISDPRITLNKLGSPPTTNATDIGMIFIRGSTESNVALIWDESADEFALVTTTADGSQGGDMAFTGYADLHVANITSANGGGSGLSNIVEDTTPQLGGDLDVNGFSIVSLPDEDINIVPGGVGNVKINRLDISGRIILDNTTADTPGVKFVDSVNNTWGEMDVNLETWRVFSSYRGGAVTEKLSLDLNTGNLAVLGNLTVNNGSAVLTDAPSDGSSYVRKDGAWVAENPQTIDWQIKTANYTAVSGNYYLNIMDAAFTLTLPTSPSTGDWIFVKVDGQAATNNMLISRNGSLIDGAADDLNVDVNNAEFMLTYSGATRGWIF